MKKISKKVVLVIAFENFQDIEYQDTRNELEKAGIQITVASSSLKTAKGTFGTRVRVDKVLAEIKMTNYDALVFIGGPGAVEYIEDPEARRLIQEATDQDKLLAAICIAPEILAKAEVLNGKKATVWSSVIDKEPIEFLKKQGAIYQNSSEVVVDGKIITANGPSAAKKFGQKIVEALK